MADKVVGVDSSSTRSNINDNDKSHSTKPVTSSKPVEDSNHKSYKKYFIYVRDADDITFLKPVDGKLFEFQKRNKADAILSVLKEYGKHPILLSESIR